ASASSLKKARTTVLRAIEDPSRSAGRVEGGHRVWLRVRRRASRHGTRSAANRACYTPRPIGPTGIGAGSGRSGTADVGTSGANHRRPARPRAAAGVAGARARPGVEGPAAAVGPYLPSDVLVSRELPGRPHPRLHRPVLAAR